MQLVIKNISQLLTLKTNGNEAKTGKDMNDLGIIENGCIYIEDEIIKWVGETGDFKIELEEDASIIDASGLIAMPGFVDCHTHILFSGSRENEFSLRAEGYSYQQIAEEGGGIISSVNAVRDSDKRLLKKATDKRLDEILSHGTTTVEIKSGYGLDFKNEIKMLEAINELCDEHMISIVPTFLGAHAFPPDYSKEKYIDIIINEMIPYVAAKKLSKYCDVFCEKGYFDIPTTRKILEKGKEHGLIPKIHAEELTNTGGVELGIELEAISVDHLEHISDEGIKKLSNSKTIAVLLPGVSFFLNHNYAPARKMIDSGVRVALSSDYNPGSCMTGNMQLMLTMAVTQMKITIEEAISAATINGAAACGLSDKMGSIEIGKYADIILIKAPNYKFIAYHYGINHIYRVIKHGKILEY